MAYFQLLLFRLFLFFQFFSPQRVIVARMNSGQCRNDFIARSNCSRGKARFKPIMFRLFDRRVQSLVLLKNSSRSTPFFCFAYFNRLHPRRDSRPISTIVATFQLGDGRNAYRRVRRIGRSIIVDSLSSVERKKGDIDPKTEVITEADCSRNRFLTRCSTQRTSWSVVIVGGNCWKRVPIRSPRRSFETLVRCLSEPEIGWLDNTRGTRISFHANDMESHARFVGYNFLKGEKTKIRSNQVSNPPLSPLRS